MDSESASGTPVLSITYTYSSEKSSDTVSFYETGANRYVASVNGTSVGHVHKANINKAVKQIADVAANKQVDSVF